VSSHPDLYFFFKRPMFVLQHTSLTNTVFSNRKSFVKWTQVEIFCLQSWNKVAKFWFNLFLFCQFCKSTLMKHSQAVAKFWHINVVNNRVTWAQFHQRSTYSFYARGSRKRNYSVKSSVSFMLLGSTIAKAVHKYIDEIDTWGQFHQHFTCRFFWIPKAQKWHSSHQSFCAFGI